MSPALRKRQWTASSQKRATSSARPDSSSSATASTTSWAQALHSCGSARLVGRLAGAEDGRRNCSGGVVEHGDAAGQRVRHAPDAGAEVCQASEVERRHGAGAWQVEDGGRHVSEHDEGV